MKLQDYSLKIITDLKDGKYSFSIDEIFDKEQNGFSDNWKNVLKPELEQRLKDEAKMSQDHINVVLNDIESSLISNYDPYKDESKEMVEETKIPETLDANKAVESDPAKEVLTELPEDDIRYAVVDREDHSKMHKIYSTEEDAMKHADKDEMLDAIPVKLIRDNDGKVMDIEEITDEKRRLYHSPTNELHSEGNVHLDEDVWEPKEQEVDISAQDKASQYPELKVIKCKESADQAKIDAICERYSKLCKKSSNPSKYTEKIVEKLVMEGMNFDDAIEKASNIVL